MKKLIKFSIALGNGLVMQALFSSPVLAQTLTPTATPTVRPTTVPTATPTSTTSALPEAGTFPVTILLLIFGIALVVFAYVLLMRRAEETVEV